MRGRALALAALILGLLVAPLVVPQEAAAWPFYFDDHFLAKYPSWPYQSQPGNCLVCHTTVSPPPMPRNAYGLAFAGAKQGSNAAAALAAIANQDSDGDGVPNEVEILFGAYPGNSASKPAAPSGLKASDATFADKVQLTWTVYPNATFQVHRGESSAGPQALLASPSSSTYADTTAVPGQAYYYWVKACHGAWCTDFSAAEAGTRKVADAQPPPSGPSGATGGRVAAQKGPGFADAKVLVPGTALQKALSPKLGVEVVTARCFGKNYQSGGQGLPNSWLQVPALDANASCAIDVKFKNTGSAKSEPGTVTLKVIGGKKVGTYGSSYNQTFTKPLPVVGPNQMTVVNIGVNVTDAGSYLFQTDWTPK
ncbi:MAG TPA: hypothetical protein VGT02_08145 [Methylomirabilota bacterium]|nr:hypothetical protein [Methylomirabilota bacterium]